MTIVKDGKVDDVQKKNLQSNHGDTLPEGPPPYVPVSPQTTSAQASTTIRDPAGRTPPDLPASNYLTIKRENTSIKGTCVIDASLQTPDGPTPHALSVDGVEPRKNLCLECKNGSISTDVWLVGAAEEHATRAVLDVKTQNGSISVRLNSATARPYALTAYSRNGAVSVALAPTFVGPVTMSTVNGSISFSDALASRLITFSEIDGKRSCFVGDFRGAGYAGRESWTGPTVDIGSQNGRLKLSFTEDEPAESSFSGFWARLFRGI